VIQTASNYEHVAADPDAKGLQIVGITNHPL
jgi:hypothetical protein